MGTEPPIDSGCECCGEDHPWTMVTDPNGHTLALCAECIDTLTPQWWPVGEPTDA
jgi:hypothetical protein